jgi:DNA-binding NtrC family response regulator
MARVRLAIADPVNGLTLKTLLEADGHIVGEISPDVIITDNYVHAVSYAERSSTLVLAGASQVRDAVDAMRRGVFGYIYVPLVPGEAALMVRRAVATAPIAAEPQTARLEEVEMEHILEMLRRCKGNRAEAARQLGIGRNTLWRKLKRIQAQRRRETESK